MVLFGEQVPDAQRDGYRPVKDAERGKGSQATVVGKSFRLRQAKRTQILRKGNGNGALVQGRSQRLLYRARARAAPATCWPPASGRTGVAPASGRSPR